MEILNQVKTILADLENQRKAAMKLVQENFGEMFKPIFAKSQKIKSVSWTQYSPYFNDGDECTFSAHVDDLDINGENQYDVEEEDNFTSETFGWGSNQRPNPNYDPAEGQALDEITRVLNSIPEEFLQDIFGNQVKVTLNADGTTETEEYEHD